MKKRRWMKRMNDIDDIDDQVFRLFWMKRMNDIDYIDDQVFRVFLANKVSIADDRILDRLFWIYTLTCSSITCTEEDPVLIEEGLISKERKITKKGVKYIEGLDVTAKMRIINEHWIGPLVGGNLGGALGKLIESSKLEELPEFLAHKVVGVRKIAAETYKRLKEESNG